MTKKEAFIWSFPYFLNTYNYKNELLFMTYKQLLVQP